MQRHFFALPAVAAIPAAAIMLVAPALPASAQAQATALRCHASVSNSHPKDYSTVDVFVTTASRARVTTVAHYKTTNTTHHATAGPRGHATIPYRISGATPGYRVKVSVSVRKGTRHGSCSTSFTPHR